MSSKLLLAEKFINQTNKNVFLTGKAGTGKTTFLKNLVESTHKKLIVAAPTGIAAINAGGVTIHSLFQLPFGGHVPNDEVPYGMEGKLNGRGYLRRQLKLGAQKQKLLREIELLVIDEVSMLRSDLLDAIDFVLKFTRRKRNVPFGGVQVLFVGDLLQLPPVVKNEEWNYLKTFYQSPFFFDAQVLKEDPPVYIELEKVFRQQDEQFISLLNHFRENKVTKEDVVLLNRHFRPDFEEAKEQNDKGGANEYILLTTHNHKVDAINHKKLNELNENSYTYQAEVRGDFKENSYPHPSNLEFKIGAQVMFVKNDPSGRQQFFNGKIGKISALQKNQIEVVFSDGSDPVMVEKYQWENIKYEVDAVSGEVIEKVVGTFTAYPIKLAWAITVHKSQGLTFDKAILDLEGAFASGQAYVALSRLRSLDGLVLKSQININSIEQNKQVALFSEEQQINEQKLEEEANDAARTYLKDYLLDVFDFSPLLEDLKEHVLSYGGKKKKTVKENYAQWAMDLYKEVEKLLDASLKFQAQINRVIGEASSEYLTFITLRVEAAQNYFAPQFKAFSEVVFKHIDEVKKEKVTKSYLKELMDVEALLYNRQVKFQKALALCDSLLQNTLLTKDKIDELEESNRGEALDQLHQKQAKKAKQEKGATKKISFEMYQSGKNIEEIAKERELSEQTIESHLAHYVASGDLDVLNFVQLDKLQVVRDKVKELETTKLGELKSALGNSVTYTDIKFALASLQ